MPDFNTYAPFSEDPLGDPEAGLATAQWAANYGICPCPCISAKLTSATRNVLGRDYDPDVFLLAVLAPHERSLRSDLLNHSASRELHQRGLLLLG